MRRFLPALFLLSAILARAAEPNPPADALTADGNALWKTWAPPILPPGITLNAHEERIVHVRCIIDDHGQLVSARVLRSADSRLDAPALAAIKAWRFSPAVRAGKPAACCLDVPIVYTPNASGRHPLAPPHYQDIRSAPFAEAVIKRQPEADYPASLSDRGLPGHVTLAWVVAPDGHVRDPRVSDATHADFVLPALAALSRWEFTPARQGDLAVASDLQGAIDFAPPSMNRGELLKANEITAPDGSAPADAPGLEQAPDPVWPYDRLLEGTAGEATAEFTVTETGRVENVKIRSASRPEFGQSLAAALATWRFAPVLRDQHWVSVPLLKHASFSPAPDSADRDDPAVAIVRAARARQISPATGLDHPLTVLFRVPPLYPPDLRASGSTNGSALLEIVIARDGRVRLTRIVSATQEPFGWAAATAFSQWIFEPPTRGGQPVDVSVQVPVNFAAGGSHAG